MKKVFLYAYDKQNLGDDLFVHTITKRYPHAKFYIWSDKKNQTVFRCLPNLKVLDQDSRLVRFLNRLRPSLLARYRAWLEKRCVAVVYIGGSIFMEYDPVVYPSWWEYEAENRPFYVLGANFGPYRNPIFRDNYAGIFAKMQDVCFRDTYSYDLFPNVPTVRQASDILFAYPMPQVPVKEKQIFVSVIDCASRDDSHKLKNLDGRYVSGMVELLKGYLEQGYTPVLCSFCKHEGDELGIQKIQDALADSRVQTLHYNGTNADAIIKALAESELVIGTRFHATILALAAGRPVLPIIYSDKTLHVLQDLGFDGVTYDIRKDGTWSAVKGTAMDVSHAKADGQKHFAKLDSVIDK